MTASPGENLWQKHNVVSSSRCYDNQTVRQTKGSATKRQQRPLNFNGPVVQCDEGRGPPGGEYWASNLSATPIETRFRVLDKMSANECFTGRSDLLPLGGVQKIGFGH